MRFLTRLSRLPQPSRLGRFVRFVRPALAALVAAAAFTTVVGADAGARAGAGAAAPGGLARLAEPGPEASAAPATSAPDHAAQVVRIEGPAGSDLPPFVARILPVSTERLGPSWREGCPMGAEDLRLVKLRRIGFDGKVHRGELIVDRAVAVEVAEIFADLYFDRFPIERMETVEKYGADDDLSMAANNTSAFNCRPITGGTSWSVHSYGRAIDVNPVQNPYISRSGTVLPPAGVPYVDRTRTDPGMIHAGDATVQAFAARGWDWGGYWTSPVDYQHFEQP